MSSRDYDRFIDSIDDGNLDHLKQYFHECFLEKIDSRSDNNCRPIHLASRNGCLEIVEYLLDKGTDKEIETTDGKRAIHFAAMEGHDDLVELLIKHDCDLESETMNGKRPIHYAAMEGHADVLKTLILNNCKIEPRDSCGNTPLALAKMCEDDECIKILEGRYEEKKTIQIEKILDDVERTSLKELIEQNHLTTIVDQERMKTVLDVVLEKNDNFLLEMIKMKPVPKEELKELMSLKGKEIRAESYKILEECVYYRCILHLNMNGIYDLSTPDIVNRKTLFMGPTALEVTVEQRLTDCMNRVLKRLIKPDESWERAINMAKRIGFEELSHIIETRQDYLEKQERIGRSRLHVAVYDNSPDTIQYIIDNNILSINTGDKRVGSALSTAYALQYDQCVQVLQKNNASADTIDKYKQSPLHVAIACGIYEGFDYLVEKMVNLEIKDVYGFTVLDRARKRGKTELCQRLRERGAEYNEDPRLLDDEEYLLPLF